MSWDMKIFGEVVDPDPAKKYKNCPRSTTFKLKKGPVVVVHDVCDFNWGENTFTIYRDIFLGTFKKFIEQFLETGSAQIEEENFQMSITRVDDGVLISIKEQNVTMEHVCGFVLPKLPDSVLLALKIERAV